MYYFHREEADKKEVCTHTSCSYRYSRAKWQRTHVGKKSILVHNEVRQHMSIGPGSSHFREGGDVEREGDFMNNSNVCSTFVVVLLMYVFHNERNEPCITYISLEDN
jgi:hypothetical protein